MLLETCTCTQVKTNVLFTVQQQWETSSDTCQYETDTKVWNNDGTITVKVGYLYT